jgi:hypothetical protein
MITVADRLLGCSGGAVYRFNMDGGERKRFYEDEGSFAGIALCSV